MTRTDIGCPGPTRPLAPSIAVATVLLMSGKRGVHTNSPAKQSVKTRSSSSSAPRRAGLAESAATKRQLAAQRAFLASAGYDVDAISEDDAKAFRERWLL